MVSPVIVDVKSELNQLPSKILEAQQAVGGSYPQVILADPALTKVYGSYNYLKLRGQDYREIFRDAKKAAKADINDDSFNTVIDAGNPEETVAELDDSPDGVEEKEETTEMVRLENPEMKEWTSSAGSKITAKLVGVEDGEVFVLVTEGGKEIRVTEDQLSLKSRIAAKELAGIY